MVEEMSQLGLALASGTGSLNPAEDVIYVNASGRMGSDALWAIYTETRPNCLGRAAPCSKTVVTAGCVNRQTLTRPSLRFTSCRLDGGLLIRRSRR